MEQTLNPRKEERAVTIAATGMSTIGAILGSPETLGDYLLHHAASRPSHVAFTFLADGETANSTLTFKDLAERSQSIARTLLRTGLSGKTSVLLHPPGQEFIVALCGCLLAGVVAVPLQPPITRRLLNRAQAVLQDCAAAAVLTTAAEAGAAANLAGSLRVILTDQIHEPTDNFPLPNVLPSSPAIVQYTSGSTGSPKGVVITQGNLISNSTLIGRAFGLRQDDVVVSWLPLLHDMGLIGSVIHVIHQGITCVHMSPQAMIRKPIRWLRAIAEYGATTSGGPDFAWRLLAERVRPEDVTGLDLSHWRVAYTGAEQVRQATLDRVAALLRPTGFTIEAFLPCYGLAEATLIVSGGPNGQVPLVSHPQDHGSEALGYVACGRPMPDDSIAIVDPNAATRRADGQEGEIWVTGAHVAAGYWGKSELTETTFHARLLNDPRSWLRTGDLGFLHEGQLHVSGRIKDLLIVNGRKHHPEDLEATVQTLVPNCATGVAAAFQAEVEGQSRLIIAVEMTDRPGSDDAHSTLVAAIRAAIWSHHEVLIDTVVVTRPGRLPRTTSGKVRRAEVCNAWATGEFVPGESHA